MSCTLSTSHGGNARRIYQINILPRTDPVTAPDTGPKPPASLIANGHWTNCASGGVDNSWNNGKSGAKLVLTSSLRPQPDCKYTSLTTAGLQILVIGCCVAVPCSHWSAVPTPLFIYISQLLRDSFSVSQQPLIWEPPSHYSMVHTLLNGNNYFALLYNFMNIYIME